MLYLSTELILKPNIVLSFINIDYLWDNCTVEHIVFNNIKSALINQTWHTKCPQATNIDCHPSCVWIFGTRFRNTVYNIVLIFIYSYRSKSVTSGKEIIAKTWSSWVCFKWRYVNH